MGLVRFVRVVLFACALKTLSGCTQCDTRWRRCWPNKICSMRQQPSIAKTCSATPTMCGHWLAFTNVCKCLANEEIKVGQTSRPRKKKKNHFASPVDNDEVVKIRNAKEQAQLVADFNVTSSCMCRRGGSCCAK